jgi:hypothetical protein
MGADRPLNFVFGLGEREKRYQTNGNNGDQQPDEQASERDAKFKAICRHGYLRLQHKRIDFRAKGGSVEADVQRRWLAD